MATALPTARSAVSISHDQIRQDGSCTIILPDGRAYRGFVEQISQEYGEHGHRAEVKVIVTDFVTVDVMDVALNQVTPEPKNEPGKRKRILEYGEGND